MIRSKGFQILRRLNVLSSIRGKITFILVALMLTAGGAGYLTYQSLDRVSEEVGKMTGSNLPQLAQSNALIMSANKTKDAMIRVLMARNVEDLAAASKVVESSAVKLLAAVEALPQEQSAELAAEQKQVSDALTISIDARANAFENSSRVNSMTLQLQQLAAELQGILLETADDAYFNISMQGDDTISSIEETMLDLVESKFATLQSLLEIRAEINLLTGISLAMATTKDSAMLSILTDLSVSSHDRLMVSMDVLETSDAGLSVSEDLQDVAEFLKPQGSAGRPVASDLILSKRQSADKMLAAAVDDMVFELTIAADDAATGNRDAIQGLLDNEVAFMNTLLEINSWLSAFQIEALKIATAENVEQARVAEKTMFAAAQALAGYREFGQGQFTEQLDGISAMAAPDSGLAFFRIKSIEADLAAAQAVGDTVEAVLKIASLASVRGLESQNSITEQALGIASNAVELKSRLEQFGWVAMGFVVGTLLLSHMLIVRPLNAISLTTERLSQGDMSPVKGFDRSSDEIARIAGALTVFRDGLVEKEELTRVAEEERVANQAQQTAAVGAIGDGLARLASGDLTYRIEEEMTDGYAQLKQDFNSTAHTLNMTVVDVVNVAESIRNGSSEINQASDDLSHRTESQAATLEETAAALEQLTASVRSAAEGARDAESTTNEARAQASESGRVVEDAVHAMRDIEDSSSQISQIISVIDDIAFQTNLLALNAGVEAARAGDAGRGFAVVASEVRGLSQRTTDAAREIKALISKSSTQVESGVDLVGRAGEALQNISERVTHISNLVSNIADSTSEQATGLGEANIAVSQLDQVTQQNAAMVEETNAAGQLLSADAKKLVDLMANFAVSHSADAHSATDDFAGEGGQEGFERAIA
ncbi:MAG: chemotaxis protein [Alphaproteobacteria bacterium MedPE-SWcel]|nr:MAG: chemotaxis protein [Alphaproteobacteria bacterium MedPE-SWcel]